MMDILCYNSPTGKWGDKVFSGNLLEMNYNVIRETVDEINIDKYLFIGKSPDFLFVLSFYSAPIKLRKIKLECLLQTQSFN